MQVQRKELLHFYVQSKPVNDVVYGQVVFDKAVLAANILKEGPMKVTSKIAVVRAKAKMQNILSKKSLEKTKQIQPCC